MYHFIRCWMEDWLPTIRCAHTRQSHCFVTTTDSLQMCRILHLIGSIITPTAKPKNLVEPPVNQKPPAGSTKSTGHESKREGKWKIVNPVPDFLASAHDYRQDYDQSDECMLGPMLAIDLPSCGRRGVPSPSGVLSPLITKTRHQQRGSRAPQPQMWTPPLNSLPPIME